MNKERKEALLLSILIIGTIIMISIPYHRIATIIFSFIIASLVSYWFVYHKKKIIKEKIFYFIFGIFFILILMPKGKAEQYTYYPFELTASEPFSVEFSLYNETNFPQSCTASVQMFYPSTNITPIHLCNASQTSLGNYNCTLNSNVMKFVGTWKAIANCTGAILKRRAETEIYYRVSNRSVDNLILNLVNQSNETNYLIKNLTTDSNSFKQNFSQVMVNQSFIEFKLIQVNNSVTNTLTNQTSIINLISGTTNSINLSVINTNNSILTNLSLDNTNAKNLITGTSSSINITLSNTIQSNTSDIKTNCTLNNVNLNNNISTDFLLTRQNITGEGYASRTFITTNISGESVSIKTLVSNESNLTRINLSLEHIQTRNQIGTNNISQENQITRNLITSTNQSLLTNLSIEHDKSRTDLKSNLNSLANTTTKQIWDYSTRNLTIIDWSVYLGTSWSIFNDYVWNNSYRSASNRTVNATSIPTSITSSQELDLITILCNNGMRRGVINACMISSIIPSNMKEEGIYLTENMINQIKESINYPFNKSIILKNLTDNDNVCEYVWQTGNINCNSEYKTSKNKWREAIREELKHDYCWRKYQYAGHSCRKGELNYNLPQCDYDKELNIKYHPCFKSEAEKAIT